MRLVRAHLGVPRRYPGSHGDVWTTTWADDGALYSVSDDTRGIDGTCSSNLALNRIDGDRPPHLQGRTVNGMADYGGWGQTLEDGGMWKANGLTCVDGVLYLSVSRHGDPSPGPDHIQQTWDASIVKSEDYGRTWSPAPRLGQAMFPGHAFSTPFFVQYGRDGAGSADGAATYVYAISSDGVWNNGSSMTLGRVPRDRIGHLDARDWEFMHGLDAQGQPRWRPRHDTAHYVFRAPGRTSMTGVHHIAPLGLYILPQWHYTRLDDTRGGQRWSATRWELYQGPAPWGPWTLFHQQDFAPAGFYNPCLPSKFISSDGRSCWIFTAGDWTTSAQYDGYYGLWMLEMSLDVEN